MKFKNLFNTVIRFWPDEIDISDGRMAETNGFRSDNLSHAWNNAEMKVTNDWEDLLVWVMYQNIHGSSRKLFGQGGTKVVISELDYNQIEQSYFDALHDDEWKSLLSDYER